MSNCFVNNNHRLRMRDADKILKKVKEAELLCRDRLIESYFYVKSSIT